MRPKWEEEASWIWYPEWKTEDESEAGRFVYFRKVFEVKQGSYTCPLRISADSRYRLFVNGVSVSRGPCKGDRFTWYYEEVEIGEYLTEGTNVIAVQVLRLPYEGGGNASVWRTRLPGLYVHAAILDEQNKVIINSHTDASWQCMKDESISLSQGVYTQFLGITETVNGSIRPFGWTGAAYRSEQWEEAAVYQFDIVHGGLKPWELRERPIPHLYEAERRFTGVSRLAAEAGELDWQGLITNDQPLLIEPGKSISIDFDAGELTTGYLELVMSGGQGSNIRLICAECYEKPPIIVPWIRDKGIRTDSVNGDLYGDVDIYRPAGSIQPFECYEPFWFRTFRYVRLEMETGDEGMVLHRFAYRETGYPLNVAAAYTSSDPQETDLWDISVRTLKRCMHETYEDCPYYEQLQYVMDTRSQIQFTYLVSGDDRMARRTLYDFYSSLLPEGLTQSRYPSVESQVIPGFSLYWILMLHDHMMFAGDRALIERYLPGVEAVLGYFHRTIDERGLVGTMNPRYWSFVDWAEEWREDYGVPGAAKQGALTVYCLMYTYALQKAAELAAYAGKSGIAEEYRTRAVQMQTAVKEHCSSLTYPGCLTDGPGVEAYSQHTQIWAVLSGTMSGERAQQAMKLSIENPDFVPCSFAMAIYLFRALAVVGLYDKVHDLLAPWRQMASDGLTTWMEDTVSKRSDAHAWGSVPIYEYATETLGVQIVAPGCEEIRIRPRIGRLKRAEGCVMTSKGIVSVEWKLIDSSFCFIASWPKQISCTIILPDGQTVRGENSGYYSTIISRQNLYGHN
ncbi:alpha-L-rhamnosidase C-terminal domain-containing protein [Paenibacillus typhae]|uniref:Alpha-L-rhamnosidase n=1 Tax=Paenibacillus typhae TaxID=1174501 RepID=A0A1G8FCG1_9BACL|nr:alpha-L-rhamnosidase C-terminal domain-containing protein [Paenibacillus typhae]SDH79841.1 alpha-L-rhamnosidase [Paenibacillus typhae]